MSKRAVLIFSGYNERGVIAFCRFCQAKNIPFAIVAAHPKDKVLLSNYRQNVIHIRSDQKLVLRGMEKYRTLTSCRLLGTNCGEIVILPSTEFLNRFILSKRKTLEAMGYVVPLCSEDVYQKISDKYSFFHLCKNHGISVPQELYPDEKPRPPFVVKPKTYFTQEKRKVNIKPLLVQDEKDFREVQRYLSSKDIFIQEFVRGRSVYFLFYIGKDGCTKVYSQENFIQQSNGRSIIAARSANLHELPYVKPFVQLFHSLAFWGLVMVEVRLNEHGCYMIEANPRLWGPSQLINDSGMDLFSLWAKDLELVQEFSQSAYKTEVPYFWSGGIVEDRRAGKSLAFHNYNKEQFLDEYDQWLQGDVYLRDDTIGIFLQEVRG